MRREGARASRLVGTGALAALLAVSMAWSASASSPAPPGSDESPASGSLWARSGDWQDIFVHAAAAQDGGFVLGGASPLACVPDLPWPDLPLCRPRIRTSGDGGTWTDGQGLDMPGASVTSLLVMPDRIVAFGRAVTAANAATATTGADLPDLSTRLVTWVSDDSGRTWTTAPVGTDADAALGGMGTICEGEGPPIVGGVVDASGGGGTWLAIGATVEGSGCDGREVPALWDSTDGLSWTRGVPFDTSAVGLYGSVYSIASNSGRWVALGNAGDWASPDGRAWSPVTISNGSGMTTDVAAVGSGFVVAGAHDNADGSAMVPVAWTSADGRTWDRHDLAATAGAASSAAAGGSGVVVVGGAWQTPGEDVPTPLAWRSSDRMSWEATILDEASPVAARMVVAGPAGTVAVAGDYAFGTSAWVSPPPP
jgi:hypothetical protein